MSNVFPTNIQEAIATSVAAMPGIQVVVKRPLRPTDANGSIGISAVDWIPGQLVIGQSDPLVAKYDLKIEALLKFSSAEEGLDAAAQLAKSIRVMLYRDNTFRIRLSGLQEIVNGVTERPQRWGVQKQTFAANDVAKNTFLRLSTTHFWVETETN